MSNSCIELEMIFMKHCAPNCRLVHKDDNGSQDTNHLKFEAILLINQNLKLPAIIMFEIN